MKSFLAVVILAWNQYELTKATIESVISSEISDYRIILVDNASTDDTKNKTQKDFPTVEVIRLEKNAGVSGGYNFGMQYAIDTGAQTVLILNNDVDLAPDAIAEMVNQYYSVQNAGAVVPKIYHYYGDQRRFWCLGAKWHPIPPRVKFFAADVIDNGQYDQLQTLEFATSCCLLISTEIIKIVGFFDEEYHFYNDDWDYSIRIRQAGYPIVFAPKAKIWHKVSMSTQKSDKPAKWHFVMGQSSVKFYLSYYGYKTLSLYVFWYILRETAKFNLSRIVPFSFGVTSGLAKHWNWM